MPKPYLLVISMIFALLLNTKSHAESKTIAAADPTTASPATTPAPHLAQSKVNL